MAKNDKQYDFTEKPIEQYKLYNFDFCMIFSCIFCIAACLQAKIEVIFSIISFKKWSLKVRTH
jgi:hypothetical protein